MGVFKVLETSTGQEVIIDSSTLEGLVEKMFQYAHLPPSKYLVQIENGNQVENNEQLQNLSKLPLFSFRLIAHKVDGAGISQLAPNQIQSNLVNPLGSINQTDHNLNCSSNPPDESVHLPHTNNNSSHISELQQNTQTNSQNSAAPSNTIHNIQPIPNAFPSGSLSNSSVMPSPADHNPPALARFNDTDVINYNSLPLAKFPDEYHTGCKEGKPLDARTYRELVSQLASHQMKIFGRPSINISRAIATAVVHNSPLTFVEKIHGSIVDNGIATLSSKIYFKVKNDKKPTKEAEKKKDSGVEKSTSNIIYGTELNYEPTIQELETLLKKKELLKAQRNTEQSFTLLSETYSLQRKDINNFEEISILHKHQANLKSEKVGKFEAFDSILEYSKTMYHQYADDSIYIISVMQLLSNYFREIADNILLIKEYYNMAQINAVVQNIDHNYPITIIAFDANPEKDPLCIVAIEKKVCFATTSISKAFAITFLSYYIFNLHFNHENEKTIEFIRRVFFNLQHANVAHPEKKTRARVPAKSAEVLKLWDQICRTQGIN